MLTLNSHLKIKNFLNLATLENDLEQSIKSSPTNTFTPSTILENSENHSHNHSSTSPDSSHITNHKHLDHPNSPTHQNSPNYFNFYKYTKYSLPEILHVLKKDKDTFKNFVLDIKNAQNKIKQGSKLLSEGYYELSKIFKIYLDETSNSQVSNSNKVCKELNFEQATAAAGGLAGSNLGHEDSVSENSKEESTPPSSSHSKLNLSPMREALTEKISESLHFRTSSSSKHNSDEEMIQNLNNLCLDSFNLCKNLSDYYLNAVFKHNDVALNRLEVRFLRKNSR